MATERIIGSESFVDSAGVSVPPEAGPKVLAPFTGRPRRIPVPGEPGPQGKHGKSHYDIWLETGNKGSKVDFLNSLKGADGKSAYQSATEKGFTGTEEEWLKSLEGKPGKSAYELARDAGFIGDEAAWRASLKGADVVGTPGRPGVGLRGESNYDIAFRNGFTGTETEYLDSLKGPGLTKTWKRAIIGAGILGGAGFAAGLAALILTFTHDHGPVRQEPPVLPQSGGIFIPEGSDINIKADKITLP